MMQKKIAAGLAVLLAAGTILGGCGESGAAGNDSVSDAAGNEAAALTEAKTTPYGRYPETITYTLAKMTGVNNSNLPEGETYEDNAYTRLIREIINVQNEDVYENYGDTYNVGISTMIATGNIADIKRERNITAARIFAERERNRAGHSTTGIQGELRCGQ